MALLVKTSTAIRLRSRGVNKPVFFAKSMRYKALALVAIGMGPNLWMMLENSFKSFKASSTSSIEENIVKEAIFSLANSVLANSSSFS